VTLFGTMESSLQEVIQRAVEGEFADVAS
jgi:hypothetical protein